LLGVARVRGKRGGGGGEVEWVKEHPEICPSCYPHQKLTTD